MVAFFLIQQQENHLLQPLILSRAVKVNPLAARVSMGRTRRPSGAKTWQRVGWDRGAVGEHRAGGSAVKPG